MSDKIEKYTFGTLPTIVEVEVNRPVPILTPFIPEWIKWVLGVLGITTFVMMAVNYKRKKREKENTRLIEAMKLKKAQDLEKIAEQSEIISEYETKYKTYLKHN